MANLVVRVPPGAVETQRQQRHVEHDSEIRGREPEGRESELLEGGRGLAKRDRQLRRVRQGEEGGGGNSDGYPVSC